MTSSERRIAILIVVALVILAGGWFVLSWRVAHNPVGDAIGEALGVGLALLIVTSVIGAIRGRGGGRDGPGRAPGPDRLDSSP
jgi:hypothetical protein